ncbi:MAG: phytanoyl-CoA dioxygenase family protein [Chloroflexi bacterium]|jgi:hypothetical protein|nr:phytanoyl-CoA dioxygenase family protein [Chloroflexota bacterium]
MTAIYFDPVCSDEQRRALLYNGDILVYSPRPSTRAFCEFARAMIREAFAPLDPERAQFSLPVERFVAILADLKPRFIHHPQSKALIRELLQEFGCDPEDTYFDVPRLRTMTHGDYLRAGIAYALHPHRDTWYAAPLCQQNWWLPIYDLDVTNCMAFHPQYWAQPVRNGSSRYNHYEWNRTARGSAAQHIQTDAREQPRPEEPLELEPELRIVCRAGSVILFSGAQLHSTVANTSGRTRFSIDFRVASASDLAARYGALNVDSAPQGTTLWELRRVSDLARLPEEIIRLYDSTAPEEGREYVPSVAADALAT